MADDYGSPSKEALDAYFEPFLDSGDQDNFLQTILDRLETATSLDEVRQVWLVDFRDLIDHTDYGNGKGT